MRNIRRSNLDRGADVQRANDLVEEARRLIDTVVAARREAADLERAEMQGHVEQAMRHMREARRLGLRFEQDRRQGWAAPGSPRPDPDARSSGLQR